MEDKLMEAAEGLSLPKVRAEGPLGGTSQTTENRWC